ncbi:circadian locomoter output cycles protein kaput isoform X2 [Venturia canescens]|uniref:circadian locomoter output cycles protein kaput isoform X2 n=1 Tax=Venturia canescens TaxID=32260 RepID=UPI001C9D5D29|nr:circadian locomoter output cycles protein kaput isoform X2 [Venturia canescens]
MREAMDDDNDDKDDTKRKFRNLSEKKRRDQFNMLVNELGSMVTANTRKMDKSTVLRSTILFLKNHDEVAVRSRVHEIQEDWKPSFLSNEEFTHLILEALDGFIMVFSSNGRIYYASESVTSLLGYLPSELAKATIYEITYQEDQSHLYNILLNPGNDRDQSGVNEENQVSFTCHIRRGGLDFREETIYELVQFVGYFRSDTDIETLLPNNRTSGTIVNDTECIFVGTGRLRTPQLIRDMSFVESSKSEFTSKHSLEWKFLFLDHRAPPIIGYLPFEVLGTSGYDYYHVDDLEKVVLCHESLMQKGEGTSCHYRFLTKGQQWIWLKTRFYIDYNQWNSKPEFIVCTHNVVSYTDVIQQFKSKNNENASKNKSDVVNRSTTAELPVSTTPCPVTSSKWSPKSSKTVKFNVSASRPHYQGKIPDEAPMSTGSQSSRQFVSATNSSRTVAAAPAPANTGMTLRSRTPPETSPKNRSQTRVDQASPNFVELQRFTSEPTIAVTPDNFIIPAVPATRITLPITSIMNQQNINLTTAQNRIQDELQRKHEELQQLIVHQQEELRRVSEQLFIARYGILSPLINSGSSYNVALAQPSGPSNNSSDAGEALNSSSNHPIQGINILPAPDQLSAPTVPMGPFQHSTTALSVNNVGLPLQQHHHHHHHHHHHPQSEQQQQPPPQQQQASAQQQQHPDGQGHDQNHQRQQPSTHVSHQDDQMIPMTQFPICTQPEIPYGNVDLTASTQQLLNH